MYKILFCLLFFKIQVKAITDSTQIKLGKESFELNCASCHNFKMDGIGPNLSGISNKVTSNWMATFIHNPQQAIDNKDPRALAQLKQYKVVMPAFDYLEEKEIYSIIAYINTFSEKKVEENKQRKEILDPIPQKVGMSDLVLNLELFTEIPHSSTSKLHTRIVKMGHHPISKNVFMLDLNGVLYQIKDKKPVEYLNIAKFMLNFINTPGFNTGFGSFAFHPDFAKNGLFYTTHSEKAGSAKADFSFADSIKVSMQWVVSEWKAKSPNNFPFEGTHRELFRVNMLNQTHGVQEIAFNPYSVPLKDDYGLLYIGIGDGGSAEKGYQDLPNNKANVWGTLLRIDPIGKNSKNGKYGIPISNPFKKEGELEEIFAMGFRNPHRFSWTKSGKMLVSNIGQKNIEAVYIVNAGANHGWPMREGTFELDKYGDLNKVFSLQADDSKFNFTYPVIQIDHDEISAISGGYEYTGTNIPQLKGKYIFGSIMDGKLFYANENDLQIGRQAEIKEWRIKYNGQITTFEKLTNNPRIDLRIGIDAENESYIFTKPDGKVYKLTK
jgi:cytochrome c2